MDLVKRSIKEKKRVEFKERNKVIWIEFGDKNNTKTTVYFNKNEKIEYISSYIGRWKPHLPPELVEKVIEKYGNAKFYSLSINDFELYVFNGMFLSENLYNGIEKEEKELKKFIEKAIKKLKRKYKTSGENIKIRTYQHKYYSSPKIFRNIFEDCIKNGYKMFFSSGRIGIENNTLILRKIKPNEIEKTEKLLEKYGKTLYNDNFHVCSYETESENEYEPRKLFIKY